MGYLFLPVSEFFDNLKSKNFHRAIYFWISQPSFSLFLCLILLFTLKIANKNAIQVII